MVVCIRALSFDTRNLRSDLQFCKNLSMTTFGVTLLSGGLDSTTVTAYAKHNVDHLTAITFHYGQAHGKEVDCARRIAAAMGIEHKFQDISFLSEVAWYSGLTNPDVFPIPNYRKRATIGSSSPITYVPLRNTVFLVLSAAYLESRVLHEIEVGGMDLEEVTARLYMAANAIDYSGYPDCRPEYVDQITKTLYYGSKLGAEYDIGIHIETPIIGLSKSDIVKMGVALEAPLDETWSCYHGGEIPCGVCDSCVLRAKGFGAAGVRDPLLIKLGVE